MTAQIGGTRPVARAKSVLAAFIAAACMGCTTVAPPEPFPSVVHVPYPHLIGPAMPRDQIEAMYSASPNLDPDGRGPSPQLLPWSYLYLIPAALPVQVQQANRLAYARTDEEQDAVLRGVEQYYREHVVLEGVLAALRQEGIELDRYQPEGIYLVDDRGRRFHPTNVESNPLSGEERFLFAVKWFHGPLPEPSDIHETLRGVLPPALGIPHLVFPGEAITPETRAITLYLAVHQKRMSFTWVFDPTYDPPGGAGAARSARSGHGTGFQRMWRLR